MTGGHDPVEQQGPRWIDVAALACGAADEPLLDEHGRFREPLLVVDLGCAVTPETAAAAAWAASRSGRILVGLITGDADAELVTGMAPALDVTLVRAPDATVSREMVATADPETATVALYAAARANPHASTVLAGLLRWSGGLAVPAALAAESFAYSTLLGGPEFRAWLRRRGPRPLPPAAATPVLVERHDDKLHLTLNRPQRRNAYGRVVRDALVDALQLALLDENLTVVLDGAGPSFCSGGDLDEFGTAPDPVTAHLVRTTGGAGLPVHRLADRIEVRVHGPCVGAGVELPAFAGRILAHPDTTFRLPEIGMGLIPGAGGTVSIPRRIGRWRAMYMALTGAAVDAHAALDWGLIDSLG